MIPTSPRSSLALAAGVAVLMGALFMVRDPSTAANTPYVALTDAPTSAAIAPSSAMALFVGDDYAADHKSFACRTARLLGWGCVVDAVPGTGYMSGGASEPPAPYESRLASDAVKYDAAWVIVSGGGNDEGDRDDKQHGAMHYFQAVHRTFPGARVVVLSPFLTARHPSAAARDSRAGIMAAAQATGVQWIDTTGWVHAGDLNRHGLPDAAAQSAIAQRLADAIVQ